MKAYKVIILTFLVLTVCGLVGSRKDHEDKAAMMAEIESVMEAEAEPESINRVEWIIASRPDDWEPTYVGGDGQIYYPQVMERIGELQKDHERNVLNKYLAERDSQRAKELCR